MTAAEHRSFRGEFFDVDFSDDEAEKRAMASWPPFRREQRPASSYNRDIAIAARRQRPSPRPVGRSVRIT
jgi:hypothetical protein